MASETLLSTFDVDCIATEVLLFRTGYLSALESEVGEGIRYYKLGYPNREVRQISNVSLLGHLTGDVSRRAPNAIRLSALLRSADMGGLEHAVHAFFASVPYEWQSRNEIARCEDDYASVFYSDFAGLGPDSTVEESGSRGRLDMAVRVAGRMYLFQFKVLEQAGPGAATAQLRERGYADGYRSLGEPVHLVAVEFSAATTNVAGLEAEVA